MKTVYYKRYAGSDFHVHAFSSAECFYIPNENVVLGIEQLGSFGRINYYLTDRAEILEEAKVIEQGKIPLIENITFFNIKKFEVDNSKIRELIIEARLKKELEEKVKLGIESLKTHIPS
jgi:hypothetical protein